MVIFMKRMTTKTRFHLGVAAILLTACVAAALMAHRHLKDKVYAHIHKETEIFVGAVEATRTYVKDVLRPEISRHLPPDAFVPCAMSTSFVGREVMARMKERFPSFLYKRAAFDPMNPINRADALELGTLKWFQDHPGRREWQGILQRDTGAYFTRFRAIYAEASCLQCHGDPADAPAQLRAIYGDTGGYHYEEGDVVAADVIYIPVDLAFIEAKDAAWGVFVVAAIGLLALSGLLYSLFNRTVVRDMKGLLRRFHAIHDAGDASAEPVSGEGGDEFAQIKGAFERTAVDLKTAHESLKASEAKYKQVFEHSSDAILIIDRETRLTDINPAGLELFGFLDYAEALSIETVFQLFWDARDADRFLQTVRRKGTAFHNELPMVDREGRQRIVSIRGTARRDEGNGFQGMDVWMHDLTDRRRFETQMAQTEKLAAIGQLAAGVAHEVNNPMGVIQCYARLIAKSQEPDSQAVRDAEIIQKHIQQCQKVVADLLNFARVSESRKQTARIDDCLDEVVSLVEPHYNKKGITVSVAKAPDLPPAEVDEAQFKQVLMNLVINAVQSMPDGGRLTVAADCDEAAGALRVSVADTGMGIGEKDIRRIFEPFFTTKDPGKGTGLGLSVSYGIIQQHGGDIRVESVPGEGSTFTVMLPLTDDPEERDGPA